jgi:polyisoprenoid-binding protein YceI
MMRLMLGVAAAAALAACSPASEKAASMPVAASSAPSPVAEATPAAPAPSVVGLPAGKYTTDKAHSSLVFSLSHMGFSHYTASFTKFDAELQLDPAKPADASLTATIDPNSLLLNTPPAGFLAEMTGEKFFETKKFPAMTFKSTKVETTGANTANVTGDFTMHGVTKPVTLQVIFNGGYPGMMQDPHARIGFSAKGSLKRADFGMAYGVPAPGTTMGVGDEVSFAIETEMTGPAAPASAAPKPN